MRQWEDLSSAVHANFPTQFLKQGSFSVYFLIWEIFVIFKGIFNLKITLTEIMNHNTIFKNFIKRNKVKFSKMRFIFLNILNNCLILFPY